MNNLFKIYDKNVRHSDVSTKMQKGVQTGIIMYLFCFILQSVHREVLNPVST